MFSLDSSLLIYKLFYLLTFVHTLMGVTKVRYGKYRGVLLSETRVTSANQSSVISEMGHSCMQTSRHWGGN